MVCTLRTSLLLSLTIVAALIRTVAGSHLATDLVRRSDDQARGSKKPGFHSPIQPKTAINRLDETKDVKPITMPAREPREKLSYKNPRGVVKLKEEPPKPSFSGQDARPPRSGKRWSQVYD
jgi:hypothetical protein